MINYVHNYDKSMNLKFILLAVKRYGVKGIVNFLQRKLKRNSPSAILRSKMAKITPTAGITIVGCLDYPGSLSKVLRDLAELLKKANIPFQVLNLPCAAPIPDSEFQHLLTPKDEFVTNKYTEIITMRQTFNIPDKRCRVSAIEFWEFEDGLAESQPEVVNIHNLIAMSDFNLNVFKTQLPSAHVRKILYPFQFSHGALAPIDETRRKYGIPTDAFMVFFNFDYASSYYRKNPEAILKAFHRAFTDKEKAVIVFKTMRAKRCKVMSDRLHATASALGLGKQLITIDDFIPQEDLVNLTNACDVYISLHRGEGFGLGIAEAMALGKPVIVTDYSSTTEFCKPDNAMLVPYEIVSVPSDQHDVDAYDHVTHWAEPDVDAAAKALRRLYDNPQLRDDLGSAAKSFITNYFSAENFKKSVESFLAE